MSSNSEDALDAARRAFDAIEQSQWDRFAQMIDPQDLADIRERQLALLIAWAQYRPDLAAKKGGSVGFSSSGTIDPAQLAQYADMPIRAFRGDPSLGALAALDPLDFVTQWLPASHDGMFGALFTAPRECLGVVSEGDELAHVVYRRDQGSVEVISLRRADDGRWLVLASDEMLRSGSGLMFTLMHPDGFPEPGE